MFEPTTSRLRRPPSRHALTHADREVVSSTPDLAGIYHSIRWPETVGAVPLPPASARLEAWLEDLSQNGTFVNGTLVGKNKQLAHRKVVARTLSKNYMAGLSENVFRNLAAVGFYTNTFKIEVLDNDAAAVKAFVERAARPATAGAQ